MQIIYSVYASNTIRSHNMHVTRPNLTFLLCAVGNLLARPFLFPQFGSLSAAPCIIVFDSFHDGVRRRRRNYRQRRRSRRHSHSRLICLFVCSRDAQAQTESEQQTACEQIPNPSPSAPVAKAHLSNAPPPPIARCIPPGGCGRTHSFDK